MKKRPARTVKAKPPVKPKAAPVNWGAIAGVAVVVLAVLAGVVALLSKPEPHAERRIINDYVDAVCEHVLDKLAAANDGDLTGEQALKIIETSIPIVQKHTWKPVTDKLTGLQVDGVFDQEKLAKAIDETREGLQSCKQ